MAHNYKLLMRYTRTKLDPFRELLSKESYVQTTQLSSRTIGVIAKYA